MKAGIAGAGIMGRLLAFKLVNAGWQVTLFDQDEQTGTASCSMAAAGLLTPFTELAKSNLLSMEFGYAALNQHWDTVIQSLPKAVYFAKKGSLVLAHPQDRAELSHFISAINTKLIQQPVYQKLSAGELHALEPELSQFDSAYYFPEEGQLDNQAMLSALGIYLTAQSIHWHEKTVVNNVKPGKIIANDQHYAFDVTFDCRGLGAKANFPELRGLRGELIWVYAPEVHLQRPVRLCHPRYSLYIVPRPDQIYLLGASEIESEHQTGISVRTVLELLSAAAYCHHGFLEATVIKTVQHCRPTLPDLQPMIKFSDGFIAINGLYRHGFSLAPSLSDEVMLWLQSGISKIRYPKIWNHYYEYLREQ